MKCWWATRSLELETESAAAASCIILKHRLAFVLTDSIRGSGGCTTGLDEVLIVTKSQLELEKEAAAAAASGGPPTPPRPATPVKPGG